MKVLAPLLALVALAVVGAAYGAALALLAWVLS